ncbi:glycosyltransferase family 2 protein [Rhodococcoides corynebacterioides]|uniref:Glycosyltransferase family 2 protein n=1 Tax=Rhodococcoides corynebacterioides TaxID=53972 RepID=A0ABS7P5Q7_9NOCA|nr:glycosyltransferase family 2 protein [Rhodococcus corynebacterioides]MBY6367655.1 glycosyltransferase family 2 protein [Rhodococcus corynebacterioides]MBY6408011.1 glycosyltransferase family 2 protein [Rhodococcus corynebacterioides]
MLLSVVVPCHNEESVLDALVDAVLAVEADLPETVDGDSPRLEVVLVDDGSRDATKSIMRARHERDERVRYVSFSRNFGKESAMLAGLSYARGDAVVIMDADLQHPPHLIADMVRLHREGYDQVVARRTRDGDSRGRTAMSRMYYRLVNRVVDVSIEDGAGDFRLLSRRAVDALLQMGEYNRFSKGLFSWIGFPAVTVDYRNEPRQGGGESKWTLRRLLNYGLDGVMSFNNAPLRLAIYLGAAAMVVGFAYVVFLICAAVVAGVTVPGYVTLVAAIIGFGGLQLLFLGVIGEYVGRIYYEVKQRPHYLVAETEPGIPTGGHIDPRIEQSSGMPSGRFRPSHAVPAFDSGPNGPTRRESRRGGDA